MQGGVERACTELRLRNRLQECNGKTSTIVALPYALGEELENGNIPSSGDQTEDLRGYSHFSV